MAEREEARDQILRLLIRHNGMLSGYIYSLVEDWTVVEETLQETAVFICNHWEDFTPGTNFGAWARTIARNRCREILHKEHRQYKMADSLADHIEEAAWDEYGDYSPSRKQALTQCLKELPSRYRAIIDMRYVKGCNCSKIAEAMEKSLESVYMTLTRIRRFLKKCIENKLSGETV